MSVTRRRKSDQSIGRLKSIDESVENIPLAVSRNQRLSIASLGLTRRKWRRNSISEDVNVMVKSSKPGPVNSGENGAEHDDKRKSNRSKQLKQKRALFLKFRLVAKMAVFCIRQAREHRLKDKLYDEIMPYVNDMHFHDYETDNDEIAHGLSFDPSKFKADKQLRMSEETKRVLCMRPKDRSPRDLTYAQLALRNIESIAEYPVRMQRKIVEVATYEKYDAKRVIVRQGHTASAFYIILSGSVVVMVTDPETNVAKPVAYLPKGKPFGELAIMKRTIRHASIIAKETLELLSIDIKDFHRIFMAGGHKNIHDPDHNHFIRSISFLRGWPLEKMAADGEKCQFFYFKQGEIVVRDSRHSKWMYIVKSGSLKVMKKLKRVNAFEWRNRRTEMDDPEQEAVRTKGETEKKEARDQRRQVFPMLGIPLKAMENNEMNLLALPPLTHCSEIDTNRFRRLRMWTSDSNSISDSNDSKDLKDSRTSFLSTSLPSLQRQDTLVREKQAPSYNKCKKQKQCANIKQHSVILKGSVSSKESFDFEAVCDRKVDTKRTKSKGKTKKVMFRIDVKVGGWTKPQMKDQEEEEVQREMKGRRQEIRTMVQELDGGYKKHGQEEVTDADLDPQFVHVQTLTKGQVFGLRELVFGDQPRLCVVSNGAELILLDKQYYMQHAPEDVIRRLKQECSPFPSDEVMQEGLQASVDWEAYKNITFTNTLQYLQEKRSHLLKSSFSFRPSFTLKIASGKSGGYPSRPFTR